MTPARYRSYRRAVEFIDLIEEHAADSERRLLREAAEDLLLSREAAQDGDDPLDTAVAVLTQMVVTGAVSRSLAHALMEALHGSGPGGAGPEESPAPSRALARER